MPRELNIEKLEKKFNSLTRSRESIQALSSWIMHHHEFCEDIVVQWYISLTKDQNALVMFYVANEVIQNCGKKRVPQYREAFTKALEKAVCLEKVKEIKLDVFRLLTLWKERSIFDDDFIQKLETKLNGSEVIPAPPVEKEELSELDIISNFKSENLFNSLKSLKIVETESKEKEDILKSADEPLLPELNNLTVRDERLEMMKKIDSFYGLVKQCLKATNKEIKARESAVQELKCSCIFYTAQHGDVKKVANAYMTYGKRLKNIENKLSEKVLILPSPVENESPCYSESNISGSPIVGTSPFDHDTSSASRFSSRPSPSASNEKSHNAGFSSDSFKNNASFWNKMSKRASSDFPKSLEMEWDETMEKGSEESPKFSKLTELFAETKSEPEKQTRSESNTLDSLTGSANLESISSPIFQNENSSDIQVIYNKIGTLNSIEDSTESSLNQESKDSADLNKISLNEKGNSASVQNASEIDLLLEESYDTKKAKSNVSVKRKIKLLMHSKGKRICTDASKENSDNVLASNTSAEYPVLEVKNSSENAVNEDNINQNNLSRNNKKETCNDPKITIPLASQSCIKINEKEDRTCSDSKETVPLALSYSNSGIMEDKTCTDSNAILPFASLSFNTENDERSNDEKGNKNCTGLKVIVPLTSPSSKKIVRTSPCAVSVEENMKVGVNKNVSLEEKIQNISNILVPSSHAIEQCKDTDFLSEQSNTQDSLPINYGCSGEDNIKNNSIIIPESNFDSESSIIAQSDSFSRQTPSTFLDSSLFSSISSISTEFLKNILEKNKRSPSDDIEGNPVTNASSTKDSTKTEKHVKSKDSEVVKFPVPDFIESEPQINENLLPFNIMTKTSSQNEITENTVKIDLNTKEEAKIKSKEYLDNASLNFNTPEQPIIVDQVISDCINISSKEAVLSNVGKNNDSPISDANTKTNDILTKKPDDKSNLLLTLQNILDCICNKNISVSDSKHTLGAPPMSFENCLSMYHSFKSIDTKYSNDHSSLRDENLALSKTISDSTIYSQDNLEVMDMECDSE